MKETRKNPKLLLKMNCSMTNQNIFTYQARSQGGPWVGKAPGSVKFDSVPPPLQK